MSDFDLSLIREFRSRPGFYDRNSPLFKDKAYNAQAWQDISNILGYDVALLKDRMLQLRNRYNLEKRRMEQLTDENPSRNVQSPWPLYEHMGFLSEHIRSRRSFKRMMPRQMSTDLNMSGSNLSSGTVGHAAASIPLANGLLAVKMENDTEAESDSRSESDPLHSVLGSAEQFTAAMATIHNSAAGIISSQAANLTRDHNGNCQDPEAAVAAAHAISIRNLDAMRTIVPKTVLHSNRGATGNIPPHHRTTTTTSSCGGGGIPEKRRCLNTCEQKYEAFGQFVASSLIEMPKQQALQLVEKFTSELVKALIEKNDFAVNVNVNSPRGLTTSNGNCCRKDEMMLPTKQQSKNTPAK